MYATVTIPGTGLVKEEIMEVTQYQTSRFHTLRKRGQMLVVVFRDGSELVVWPDEITITP